MLLPKECTMKASSNQGAWVTRGPGSPRMSREETNTEKKKKSGTKWPETAEMGYVKVCLHSSFPYFKILL